MLTLLPFPFLFFFHPCRLLFLSIFFPIFFFFSLYIRSQLFPFFTFIFHFPPVVYTFSSTFSYAFLHLFLYLFFSYFPFFSHCISFPNSLPHLFSSFWIPYWCIFVAVSGVVSEKNQMPTDLKRHNYVDRWMWIDRWALSVIPHLVNNMHS